MAEGTVPVHRSDFPADVVEAFASKYAGWDVGKPAGERVLLEVPVRRWLLAGTAQ